MNSQNYFSFIENNYFERLEKLLLADKSLINEFKKSGSSGLHLAASNKSIESAKLLIDSGININKQDEDGQTALHYCAELYQYEIAKYILDSGGNLAIADKYGNQPLWTATFNVQNDLIGLDVVELFLLNGADINHKNNVGKTPWEIAHDPYFEPIIKLMKK